jgi:hypothetical protein
MSKKKIAWEGRTELRRALENACLPPEQRPEVSEPVYFFRFSARLRIFGDGLDFEEISRTLGLTPTHTHQTGYHFYSLSLPSATVAAVRLPSGFRVVALVALVFGLLGCWHRLHMLGWWRRFHINALTSAAVVLLLLDIVGVIFLLWRLSLFSASFHAHAA